MTTDLDLETQLATWFDDRASAAPPWDLLPRGLARAATVRQRPAILTRDAYAQPWVGAGRAPFAAPALLLLLGLLLVGLAVAGSQLLQSRMTVVAPAPTTSSTAIAPSQEPTPQPTPVDTRPPAIPATAAMFADVFKVAPFGDVAWVSTRKAIYRTEDAGATWRTVQPDGWVPFADAFVDADTAYVPLGDGTSVAITHDGGSTWHTTHLNPGSNAGIPVFSAGSPLIAYATYVDPAHYDKADGTGLIVFATTDGGATWSGPSRGLQPHQAAGMGKVEPGNKQFLINVPGKFDNKPFDNFFDLSSDGGITWTRYTFPISKISPKGYQKSVGDVIATADGHFIAQFSASPNGPGTLPNAIYESTDDPAAWRLLYTEPNNGDYDVEFLSPTAWIIRSGAPSEISSTTDAGATWQSVTPSTTLYYAQVRQFGSLQTGWITLECRWLPTPNGCDSTQHASFLFVTTDGGVTWTEVGR